MQKQRDVRFTHITIPVDNSRTFRRRLTIRLYPTVTARVREKDLETKLMEIGKGPRETV